MEIPRIEIRPGPKRPKYSGGPDRVLPTLTQRIQRDWSWITPAHTADWSAVDRKNGDLLYVGSSVKLWNRLNPASHLMWTIYVHETKRSPQVRLAIWVTDAFDSVEGWMTRTCLPLWSNCRHAGNDVWTWRDPDFLVKPDKFDPHKSRPLFASDTCGVYAWVCLPRGRYDLETLRQVMFDRAQTRADRCLGTPTVWNCYTMRGHLPCLYVWLKEPDASTRCPRCGWNYYKAVEKAQEDLEARLSDIYEAGL